MVAQKSSGLPWFTLAYPLEGCHFSGERGRALRAPRRPRRLIFLAASAAWRSAAFSVGFRGQNDDGKGPQLS